MANITRYDPFSINLEDFFRGALAHTLPQDLDEARVDAKLSDGLLKLTLPLREKSCAAQPFSRTRDGFQKTEKRK